MTSAPGTPGDLSRARLREPHPSSAPSSSRSDARSLEAAAVCPALNTAHCGMSDDCEDVRQVAVLILVTSQWEEF
ncbi:hypothetical protein NDU88_005494 [Pleurodeles waltl]|uniref:Uncharacterized protein n=1 Tax=Pleurodeles waltl TaxID=8319 RepID=A0AAV7L0Y9_PLEWA|nr:hypothetical protein NDU88_005494 [Pleurodeles waltl]